MCGRYTLRHDIQAIAQEFQVAPSLQTVPRYNIAPTQEVVSVLQNGAAHLELLRWGLIPSWAKEESIGSKMINARAETLAEKPSFKRLLHSKRCLVVTDGFYEWKQEGRGPKTPMYITLEDGQLFAFAGLWDDWKNPDGQVIRTCTIITTDANELIAPIHNRMPVILSRDARKIWLDSALKDEHIQLPLLAPYPSNKLEVRPVSRLVNDPRREGAELIA